MKFIYQLNVYRRKFFIHKYSFGYITYFKFRSWSNRIPKKKKWKILLPFDLNRTIEISAFLLLLLLLHFFFPEDMALDCPHLLSVSARSKHFSPFVSSRAILHDPGVDTSSLLPPHLFPLLHNPLRFPLFWHPRTHGAVPRRSPPRLPWPSCVSPWPSPMAMKPGSGPVPSLCFLYMAVTIHLSISGLIFYYLIMTKIVWSSSKCFLPPPPSPHTLGY